MKFDYYKNELVHLDKAHFNEVKEWLNRASLDNDVDFIEMVILNDLADDIYYERINPLTTK